MRVFRLSAVLVLVIMAGFILACARQPGIPNDASASADTSQAVPFDRAPHSDRISSSKSAVSTIGKLPEGTLITIRLLTPISSASSNTGDTFECALDDPIAIGDQIAVPRGTVATGRVLAAKAAGRVNDPGYLRITLLSLNIDGKRNPIETSSLFAKSRAHYTQASTLPRDGAVPATGKNEVSFGVERRLTFRLARAVDFQ
jgi:hypothetical protein